ncbi:MAG: nucleotide sugar dehydrogenase [bacterium]|jgi:UDP-N-acetyl-D-glucosamine dehydrogenase|nr:nucleotide sugar dehydrogenase [bacterium]MBK7671704.1 nucleotide sugar dehydrogenase [bacterium]MBK9775319.1 nucleotide sugar dehydrogenase [bacterium]
MQQALIQKLQNRKARLSVLGLGYVGLPLAVAYAKAGFEVVGFDLSAEKVDQINRKRSYIIDISDAELAETVKPGGLRATTDFSELANVDAVNICVPTPLSKTRDPDISYIQSAVASISAGMHPGMLVILESTTYPGTTEEVILPILSKDGLQVGKDFFLAFSPERVDPGNAQYTTINIPKVVGGVTPACTEVAKTLYSQVMNKVVPVSSVRVAETVKLLENTFRSVNIAMVNELALMCSAMDIDVWEVIAGASTKPFGFMPFYPGPGLGGHCIPIDPFYLSWKAKQYGSEARFIELAGQVNGAMPKHVVNLTALALNGRKKAINGSRVLVVGVAYKPAIDDIRESPALDIIELLNKAGAEVSWYDPHVPALPAGIHGKQLTDWSKAGLAGYDVAVIVTPHPSVDHKVLLGAGPLVVDTRNALKGERHPDLTRL